MVWEEARKIFIIFNIIYNIFNIFFSPSVHLKNKIAVTVRRGISKRSHEKIGDCEQSTPIQSFLGYTFLRRLKWNCCMRH